MNKYIVTGGAGFIGSMIVRSLLREGARQVVVIDNLLTGSEQNLDEVRAAMELHGPISVITKRSPPRERARPWSSTKPPSRRCRAPSSSPCRRTKSTSMARSTCSAPRRRAASGAWSTRRLLRPTATPRCCPRWRSMAPRPKSPYALQKLMGEYYAQIFASTFGMETVSLRYFNVSARGRIPPASIPVCCRCS